MGEREREYQRGGLSPQVTTRHPDPRKSFAPSEGDLTLAHAKLYGSAGFNRAAHGFEDLSGHVLSSEELVQCSHVFLSPASAP